MTPWAVVHEILQARILDWVAFPFPGDPPNPGIEPRSPALSAEPLPAEPQEKLGERIVFSINGVRTTRHLLEKKRS